MNINLEYLEIIAEMLVNCLKTDNSLKNKDMVNIMVSKNGYIDINILMDNKEVTSTRYSNDSEYERRTRER